MRTESGSSTSCWSRLTARRRVVAQVALILLAAAVPATPASAYSNPNYPGSTLSMALRGPAVPDPQITTIVATGTNTHEIAPPIYDLDAYAKDASIDNSCADTSSAETSTVINEPSEKQVAIGLSEGFGPFSVQFKVTFIPGKKILICGYSKWSFDTAVSAELRFTVPTSASSSPGKSKGKHKKRRAHRRVRRHRKR